MSTVHLICGKICSGKSYYAQELAKQENAVVLSVDELSLSILPMYLGDQHDAAMAKVRGYLHKRAEDILRTGTDVILEWGFWTRPDREATEEMYAGKGFDVRWHYIEASDEILRKSIEARNVQVLEGKDLSYFVDEGLFEKMKSRFEEPGPDERRENWTVVVRKNA